MQSLLNHELVKSVKQSVIICATPRSGSTLLCKTLSDLEDCGYPDEHFLIRKLLEQSNLEPPIGFPEYYLRILEENTTANGVFGLKIMWSSLLLMLGIAKKSIPELSEKEDLEIINLLFPNPYFIHISRQDILGQAVSLCIVRQREVWAEIIDIDGKVTIVGKDKKVKDVDVEFFPFAIYRQKLRVRLGNRQWSKFFEKNALPVLRITYEGLVNSIEDTIRSIYDFLELPFAHNNVSASTKKLGNVTNEKFASRYKSEFPEKLIGFIMPEIFINIYLSWKLNMVVSEKLRHLTDKTVVR